MTSRDRVLTVLAHQEPDRVPMDMWMTPEVEAELMRLTGVEDPFTMRVEAGHDLLMSSVGMVSSFYMSPGGGYILCPSHNVQPTTPMESIRAYYHATERYGGYPLRV